MERALSGRYRACIEELLHGAGAGQPARRPPRSRASRKDIRGYGHVKERHRAPPRAPGGTQLMAAVAREPTPGREPLPP
jgi:hypothetical protein